MIEGGVNTRGGRKHLMNGGSRVGNRWEVEGKNEDHGYVDGMGDV